MEDKVAEVVLGSEEKSKKRDEIKSKLTRAAFLVSVTGFSILGGFGMTVALVKKSDPAMFAKSFTGSRDLPESGAALALRALGRATLYSVGGFSLFCFGIWKLMGVKNMEEFRAKIKSVQPKRTVNEEQGKTDFKTVRELVNYLIDEDKKKKEKKVESLSKT